jgi:hypothetical protein
VTRALPRWLLVVVVASALAAAPGAARADAGQLCRSLSTLLLAPTDILLTPYIVTTDLYTGLTEQSDPMALKIIGAAPGLAFLTYIQAAGSILRVAAGVFEFIPGLITLPREGSPNALYTSQDEAEAVYTNDYGVCPVRIGVHYNTIPFG